MAPFVEHFASLPDPRVVGRSDHKLLDIIAIAILGTICGAEGWDDFAVFGECKHRWLKTFLDLPAGIPSADTFRRVLTALDPVTVNVVVASASTHAVSASPFIFEALLSFADFAGQIESASSGGWSAKPVRLADGGTLFVGDAGRGFAIAPNGNMYTGPAADLYTPTAWPPEPNYSAGKLIK
ncbi:transposase family protein [Sorangium sp. So ce315]|uniref:transposase family protein n=1 Tax=Sorangium sp. So ce315 TaxID=3133299 RepID=UPI003F5E4FC7